MPRLYQVAVVAAAFGAVLLVGCSSNSAPPHSTSSPTDAAQSSPPAQANTALTPSESSSPSPSATAAQPTAMQLAHQVKSKVSKVEKVVHITEDNDPNNLIGRPNGYTDGAILYIKGAPQDDFGVAEGAFIEIWPTTTAAEARAKYIKKINKAAPMLGNEYDTVHGRALLRVDQSIKPSYEKKIKAAFVG
ncbi:MAG TPA: hypothetical protein VIP98_23010 [Microlunatus sp.]